MRIADLPNPAPEGQTWITSIEPWQREGLLRVRELLGIDADALLRAGVTLALSIVGAVTPDAATPPASAEGASGPTSPQDPAAATLPGDGDEPEPGGGVVII
jgi:hypothetical protein